MLTLLGYRPKHRSAGELLDTLTHLLEETTVALFESPADRGSMSAAGDDSAAQRTPREAPPVPPATPDSKEGVAESTVRRVEGPDYVLTEDAHTNTIIAVGSPDFHAQLATLLDALDRRRPQVFIEMTLVAVSLSDSADLGIELESFDLGDGFDYLLFSNFGLSELDVATGQRVLAPGVGAILRDDQFADLKFITEFQLKKAELAHSDFPPDVEMWMR
ncbi:MAG: hypothetical protein HOP29_16385 [Phycisphaerales bacterium]|nr:hypothetical protein [Phycisphaerales bacterium]